MTLQADGYTFALADGVTRTPVRCKNRYGIEIAADLYRRSDLEDVHEQVKDGSELVVVPGARHIDLYDRTELIPFDELEGFFSTSLKAGK